MVLEAEEAMSSSDRRSSVVWREK